MPDPKKLPDVARWLSDPEYETDRTLFRALIDDHLTKKVEEEKKRRELEGGTENIFDRLFGGRK